MRLFEGMRSLRQLIISWEMVSKVIGSCKVMEAELFITSSLVINGLASIENIDPYGVNYLYILPLRYSYL